MYSYELRVPKDRIAVIIGSDGETKQQLQDTFKCRLDVDSSEGEVTIAGEDAVMLYSAQQVIKAIARGFNPDIALNLAKQDWSLELIDLTDYSKQKNHQQRIKGRVIGSSGKARKVLENLTGCNICVYGKTVGIIAPVDTMSIAKDAVESLLSGAKHASVYKSLERKQRELKARSMIGTGNL